MIFIHFYTNYTKTSKNIFRKHLILASLQKYESPLFYPEMYKSMHLAHPCVDTTVIKTKSVIKHTIIACKKLIFLW